VTRPPSFRQFAGHLCDFKDGRPLLDSMEAYRQAIFDRALATDDAGLPLSSMILTGRGKKCHKTSDACWFALYRLFAYDTPGGNQVLLTANDLDQAVNLLQLCRLMIDANPILAEECEPYGRFEIRRSDGGGGLLALPTRTSAANHGITYAALVISELWAQPDWRAIESLAADPTRPSVQRWFESYQSQAGTQGQPLFDLFRRGRSGEDTRMFFSWYSSTYCTHPEPDDATLTPVQRACPSWRSFSPGYLDTERGRLPANEWRRLFLNEESAPSGAAFDAQKVIDAIMEGVPRLVREPGRRYRAFADLSGGSKCDSVICIGHWDEGAEKAVVDLIASQLTAPPFNPRDFIHRAALMLREYGLTTVASDAYAGQWARQEWEREGIFLETVLTSASDLLGHLEPRLNAGEVLLVDQPKLREQLLTIVLKNGNLQARDGKSFTDWANAAAGCVSLIHRPAVTEPRNPAAPVIIPIDPVSPAMANVHAMTHADPFAAEW
jgi:hypothetical protein